MRKRWLLSVLILVVTVSGVAADDDIDPETLFNLVDGDGLTGAVLKTRLDYPRDDDAWSTHNLILIIGMIYTYQNSSAGENLVVAIDYTDHETLFYGMTRSQFGRLIDSESVSTGDFVDRCSVFTEEDLASDSDGSSLSSVTPEAPTKPSGSSSSSPSGTSPSSSSTGSTATSPPPQPSPQPSTPPSPSRSSSRSSRGDRLAGLYGGYVKQPNMVGPADYTAGPYLGLGGGVDLPIGSFASLYNSVVYLFTGDNEVSPGFDTGGADIDAIRVTQLYYHGGLKLNAVTTPGFVFYGFGGVSYLYHSESIVMGDGTVPATASVASWGWNAGVGMVISVGGFGLYGDVGVDMQSFAAAGGDLLVAGQLQTGLYLRM